MSELLKRVPAEKLDTCDNWSLPDITSKKTIAAIKKKPARRQKSSPKASNNNTNQSNNVVDDTLEITETIEDVVDEANDVEPITAEKLQKITDEAHKEGYESGYSEGLEKAQKEGYEAGITEAKNEVKEKTQRLSTIADELLNALENEQQDIEKQIIDMVCSLTKAVIKRELQTDSSSIIGLVQQAFGLLNTNSSRIKLYLHSQDKALIESHMEGDDINIHYEVDDELLPGGCRIETDKATIDASIEKQMYQVLDDFLHKRHSLENSTNEEHPLPTNSEETDDVSDE